jgi:EpsI family protein
MANRNYITIILLLLITIAVSWRFYFYDYRHEDKVNISDFPLTIDDWTSKNVPFNKAEASILDSKNIFLRKYTNKAQKSVYLYIAYSKSNLNASNPPEIAYRNLNISIVDKGKKYIIIASSDSRFKVNWLVLDNDENQQIDYYWYKVGDVYTHSYWKQQAIAAFNNLSGKNTGNALIRISTNIDNGHHEEAVNLINEFACLIIPQLYKHLP